MTVLDLACLHTQFKEQALATPETIAVTDENGTSHTYKELDTETDLLASYLRKRGVKANSNVAIFMGRSYEYIVAYIAILKAGGGYLIMDVTYPVHQIGDIVEEAAPVCIITNVDSHDILPETFHKLAVQLGPAWKEWLSDLDLSCEGIPVESTLDDLAFIAYSSGTTGKPKGIANPHQGAVFSYHFREKMFPRTEHEEEACNIFFAWEILRPLILGHTVHIIPDDTIYDPARLLRFLKSRSINRMLFTPSLLETVLESNEKRVADYMATMKNIWLNGEVVTTSLLRRCVEQIPHVNILNIYSISECHDVAASDLTKLYKANQSELMSRKFCPVGKVLPGVEIFILTEDLKICPIGVAGEIFVGGPTLAIGYLNRPQLNKERFIMMTPEGPRLYRTGDWGYLLGDGSLEICGRCDSMVKIRGYSVEVQAIEKTLMQLDCVNSTVVVVKGEEGEDKFLIAYIVPQGKPTRKEIRAELKRRLPFYMIPSFFVFLSEIPLLAASGKLDKKALPPLKKEETSVEPEFLPKTPTEIALSEIWKSVLDLTEIDIQESFFDLGGHSLLATKLLNQIFEKFGTELAVKDLFQNSTVSELARLLDKSDVDTDANKLDLNEEVNKFDQRSTGSMDIQLRAFWRHVRWNEKRWKQCCILLTGSTGFVGCFILRDILLNTKNHVFCLVREKETGNEENRIIMTFKQFGIVSDDDIKENSDLVQAVKDRVTILNGDIGLMHLGQTEDDFNYLSTEIDLIIHAAAYVNLIYPYHALQQSNVMGSNNILLFAKHSKVKPIHYISTDAVFPHGYTGLKEDEDMTQYPQHLEDGYSQTKWVAEQLMLRAKDRGHPIVIYRLGNMSGDSISGEWNPSDFTLLMLRAIATSGFAPDIDWSLEMTPVDFMSRLIVKGVLNSGEVVGNIYHVINKRTLPLKQLTSWMTVRGYPTQVVDYQKWIEKIETCEDFSERKLLLRILETIDKNGDFFKSLSTYKNDNLMDLLDNSFSMQYPQIDDSLLVLYFSSLVRNNLIPDKKLHKHYDLFIQSKFSAMSHLPLAGKVAIVTGASSGIGQAIAIRLAEAGCNVGLIARREEKLQQLVLSIAALESAGSAVAAAGDVSNRNSVRAAISTIESKFGHTDILINCAGVMYFSYMKNVKENEWDEQVDVNCKGVLNSIGAVLPQMVERKSGHIVNITSNGGIRPCPGLSVYSGTKYFVEGLSHSMRLELAESQVKVTCIQPGDVDTAAQDMSTDSEAHAKYANHDKPNMLHADDIGRAVVYAVAQPEGVGVNAILVEPRSCPL